MRRRAAAMTLPTGSQQARARHWPSSHRLGRAGWMPSSRDTAATVVSSCWIRATTCCLNLAVKTRWPSAFLEKSPMSNHLSPLILGEEGVKLKWGQTYPLERAPQALENQAVRGRHIAKGINGTTLAHELKIHARDRWSPRCHNQNKKSG